MSENSPANQQYGYNASSVTFGRPVVAPARRRFSLTGVSVPLDPVHDAVRDDLADIDVADRHFAPHYAAPMLRSCAVPEAIITAQPGVEGQARGMLRYGEAFAVLDLSAETAWGYRLADHVVGYLPAGALCAPIAPSHRVGADGAMLRTRPDGDAPPVHHLPPLALVMGSVCDDWLETQWGHIALAELDEISSDAAA